MIDSLSMGSRSQKMIFLIKRLELDSMENNPSKAISYEDIGYLINSQEKENFEKYHQRTVEGTGWPIPKGFTYELYKLVEIERIIPMDSILANEITKLKKLLNKGVKTNDDGTSC